MIRQNRNVLGNLSLAVSLAAALSLTGCGGGSATESYSAVDSGGYDAYEYREDTYDTNSYEGDTATEAAAVQQLTVDKMTYTTNIYLTAKDYAGASASVDSILKDNGALVFADDVRSSEYSSRAYHTRSINARVAAEQFEPTLEQLKAIEGVTVTSSNTYAQDKTQQYNDNAQRIELLREEYEFYRDLLDKTEDPNDVVAYTDRMFSLLDQIKTYENSNAQIDKDVAYSILNIELREDTTLQEIDSSTGLLEQIVNEATMLPRNILAALGYIILFLLKVIPSLIIIAALIVVIVLVVKLINRYRSHKGTAKSSSERGADVLRESKRQGRWESLTVQPKPTADDGDAKKSPAASQQPAASASQAPAAPDGGPISLVPAVPTEVRWGAVRELLDKRYPERGKLVRYTRVLSDDGRVVTVYVPDADEHDLKLLSREDVVGPILAIMAECYGYRKQIIFVSDEQPEQS